MSRRGGVLLAVVLAVLLAGAAASRVSAPGWLSFLDGVMGGGRGTRRVVDGAPFGTHGQRLDVWRPARGPIAGLPVVVFWYGGGWVGGSRGAYAFAARALAARGFVVVVPDYRKVPAVRFPAFLEDGAEAVRWTRDHVRDYRGDPARVALAGHSAGAYTAVMLALDRRWLRGAGVDPGIVRAAVGLCGPYDFYPFTKKRAIDAMGQAPDPLATQPIRFARTDAPPLLLVSAGADTQVEARNAVNLTARLKALGAPVTHVDHAGISHESVVMALSKPFRGRAPVLDETSRFLEGALGE